MSFWRKCISRQNQESMQKLYFSSLYTIKSDLATWYERVSLDSVYSCTFHRLAFKSEILYTFFFFLGYVESKHLYHQWVIYFSFFSCVQKSGVKCWGLIKLNIWKHQPRSCAGFISKGELVRGHSWNARHSLIAGRQVPKKYCTQLEPLSSYQIGITIQFTAQRLQSRAPE